MSYFLVKIKFKNSPSKNVIFIILFITLILLFLYAMFNLFSTSATHQATIQTQSTLDNPASKAYNSLCVVNKSTKSSETKKRIVERLLNSGFNVNASIHEENGQKINLLDLAITQDDDSLIRFLIENKGADPALCNENSKSHQLMEQVQTLFIKQGSSELQTLQAPGLDAPPVVAGTATSQNEISTNLAQASQRKLGQRLGDMAKIPPKMLAFGVGSLMYGLGMFANVALPVMIYLPFAAPVLVAWTVGYMIDKSYNFLAGVLLGATAGSLFQYDELYATQRLGELVTAPAYAANVILFVARCALGLVSRVGVELMHAGYHNEDFYTKLIDSIWLSMSDLTKHGHTPLDLSYEKIVGTRTPSFVSDYLDCSFPTIFADVQHNSFLFENLNGVFSYSPPVFDEGIASNLNNKTKS